MAFIVVLDAGHGGKDPGALGTYSKEKNINLNVVLRLGKLIKENCRDVTVIYTRQTDKFVEL
ncbi:MAG: N-acetylmuramoyl-L-alanine amidase, partial [Bacteroidaceae bacterium]